MIVCVCVCTCVCTCVCVYVHVYLYVCMCVCMYITVDHTEIINNDEHSFKYVNIIILKQKQRVSLN